ncbi:terminase [Escherichia coli]|uniref:terminase n=1 Tax=Escherichia coli TaxID=562 RepID=UPI00388D578B
MGQQKRRNEALDCFVYALAALRISISRWQLDLSALLASLQEEDGAATNKKTLADYARALSGGMNDATGRTCRCPCGTA